MAKTITLPTDVELDLQQCTCGVYFGVPVRIIEVRRKDGGNFYCPNGHCLTFGDNELERLRKQAKQAEAARVAADDQRAAAEKSNRALKGVITRERRRVANGVCPCCSRSFADLRAHMAGQHPDYAEGEPG